MLLLSRSDDYIMTSILHEHLPEYAALNETIFGLFGFQLRFTKNILLRHRRYSNTGHDNFIRFADTDEYSSVLNHFGIEVHELIIY